jgi:hypothetical protein
MPACSPQSSTWFVRSAAEACWTFSATADAAETGSMNGSGQSF